MKRTKEEAEQTKQSLLNAALAVFSEVGYEAARLKDIADTAGTTRGAIYHHFQNKAGLYKALVDDASMLEAEVVQAAIQEGGSFEQICERILVRGMRLLEHDERYRQVIGLSLFQRTTSPELAQIHQERLNNVGAFMDGLAQSMQMGITTGEARSDFSPYTLARAFLAYQNGVALLWLANGQFFPLSEEAPALAAVFLKGLLAR